MRLLMSLSNLVRLCLSEWISFLLPAVPIRSWQPPCYVAYHAHIVGDAAVSYAAKLAQHRCRQRVDWEERHPHDQGRRNDRDHR